MTDDLSVFDDYAVDEREPTHECRICEKALYGGIKEPGDDLCFWCYMKRTDENREYEAILFARGIVGK